MRMGCRTVALLLCTLTPSALLAQQEPITNAQGSSALQTPQYNTPESTALGQELSPLTNPVSGQLLQSGIDQAASALESIGNAFETVKDSLPPSEQEEIVKIAKQLKSPSPDQLYVLKMMPDICVVHTLQCGNLKSNEVKPFVDIELDCRKAAAGVKEVVAAAADRNRTFWISFTSLIVSVSAFGLSMFSTFRQRKALVELEA